MEVDKNESAESQDMFAESEDEKEDTSARGKDFSELKRHKKLCNGWKSSRVFVKHSDWSVPYPSQNVDIWDGNHVRLPWSRHNEFPKDGQIVKRYVFEWYDLKR